MKKTYFGTKLPEIGTDTWTKEMVKAVYTAPNFKYTPPKSFDGVKRSYNGKKQQNLISFLASQGVGQN